MPEMLVHIINNAGRFAVLGGIQMTIQVSALIVILALVDLALKNRVRAALRYAMWMLVVVKLFLPPGLVSPSSIAYWLAPRLAAPDYELPAFNVAPVRVAISDSPRQTPPEPVLPIGFVPSPPAFNLHAGLLAVWAAGSITLLCWILWRHREVRRLLQNTVAAPEPLVRLQQDCAQKLGLKKVPELRLSRAQHSPVLLGLLRPAILLPETLAARIQDGALQDVLLHELVHFRRRDLWANCAQVAAVVIWWWNPLVWLASARIQALRETAVDETVMLDGGAEDYPSTLVTVARYCSRPPGLSLAFLGILESQSRLEKRIRRLLDRPLPRSATLNWTGWMVISLAALSLLPMNFIRRVEAAPGVTASTTAAAAPKWETWSESAVTDALREGRPVVVEFTADGCTDCLTQHKAVLENQHVLTALELSNARLLKADRTLSNNVIETKLSALGSAGVPLFALYTPDAGAEPLLVTNRISSEVLLDSLSSQLAPVSLRLAAARRELSDLQRHHQGSHSTIQAASNKIARLEALTGTVARQDSGKTTRAASGPTYQMSPEMMKRYGLAPASNATTAPADGSPAAKPQPVYSMSPELMRRYGLTPASGGGTAKPAAESPSTEKPSPPSNPELNTRTFRLNTTLINKRLTGQPEPAPGEVLTHSYAEFLMLLKTHLANRGLPFEESNQPVGDQRPAIFLGPGEQLFVRASPAYLAALEKELNVLGATPQQIEIQTRWVDLPPQAAQSLNLSITNGEKLLLTSKQAKDLVETLTQKDGVDLLAAPKVVTLSGRAAEISVTDVRTIVTGVTKAADGVSEFVQTAPLGVGPKLHLVPELMPDGNAVHIRATSIFVQFLGYVDAKTPTPLIRSNAIPASATLWDGQTFGIGMGSYTNVVRTVDKVPLLGDVPLLGRLFRTEQVQTNLKVGLVLITPRLIDPAGKPVNPDNNLPFDPKSFPKQKPD